MVTILKPPAERWSVASTWREGGHPFVPREGGESAHSAEGEVAEDRSVQEQRAIRLAALKMCNSKHYGVHIPRTFHELLVDVEKSFAARSECTVVDTTANATEPVGKCSSEEQYRNGNYSAEEVSPKTGRHMNAKAVCGATPSPVTFHVTEYDVTQGRYPESWEDYEGYLLSGGVASACSDEPWMMTLLCEISSLRASGRPILAFCLGHQVVAQALGGQVRPCKGSYRHYGLQESELLLAPWVEIGATSKVDCEALLQLPRQVELLYHHNDEVVELPPGAINIATSGHCTVHGMVMMEGGPIGRDGRRSRLNLLTFQAHPEFNYEHGRLVMNGMLDNDVKAGRLAQDKARRLKEKVSAWDRTEFPVVIQLTKRLMEPVVDAWREKNCQ